MRPLQRTRSRSRASQRSAEAGDTQPQASKAPSGDGELQAGPPPSSRAAEPTGSQEGSGEPSSRPRWRKGALPEARGAAPEDCPHKPEDTQEPEENQREGSKQLEGAVREAIQREDKGGATQPEREDTQ